MTIEKAISSAIEGGYTRNGMPYKMEWFTEHIEEKYRVFLDPIFFRALGNTMGWKYKAYYDGAWQTEETDKRMMSDTPFRYPEWHWQWSRMIDVLAEGRSVESYFESL